MATLEEIQALGFKSFAELAEHRDCKLRSVELMRQQLGDAAAERAKQRLFPYGDGDV